MNDCPACATIIANGGDQVIPTKTTVCEHCAGAGEIRVPSREGLKEVRQSMGLSQSAVAREAGWHASIVSELESGARPLTAAAAARYWRALELAAGRGVSFSSPVGVAEQAEQVERRGA